MRETLAKPDPANLHYAVNADKSFTPLDPLLGSPLQPHALPESMASTELGEGYKFLEANAHRIDFTLLLTKHEARHDLEAAGIDLGAEARKLAANHGVMYVESVLDGETRASQESGYNLASHLDQQSADLVKAGLDQRPDRDTFEVELAHQLTGTGVDVALPDYEKDSQNPVEQALNDWKQRLLDLEDSIAHANPRQVPELSAAWQSSYVGFTAYRNKYLLSKIGLDLQARGFPPEGRIPAGLLAGSTHETIGEEMHNLGVHVTYQGERPSQGSETLSRDLVQNTGRLAIGLDDRIDQLSALLERLES